MSMRTPPRGPGLPPSPESAPPQRVPLSLGAGFDVPPAETVGPPPGGLIVDVDDHNIDAEILNRSFDMPVVVELWTARSDASRQLTPVLETLAREAMGQWVLAKVDVDRSPGIAQAFDARQVPLTLMFFQGKVIHSFPGAPPRAQIEQWIPAVFQAMGLPYHKAEREPEVPSEPAQAEAFWRTRLDKKGSEDKARLALGRLLIARGETAEAELLLNAIPGAAPEFGPAQAALALKSLITEVAQAGGEAAVRERLTNPDDAEAKYLVALLDGASGGFVAALEVLVGLVPTTKEPLRARVKKAASTLFEAAGRGDQAIENLRRKLARLLF